MLARILLLTTIHLITTSIPDLDRHTLAVLICLPGAKLKVDQATNATQRSNSAVKLRYLLKCHSP